MALHNRGTLAEQLPMGVANGDMQTTSLHAMALPMATKYCTGPSQPQQSPYDTSHLIGYSMNGVTYSATSRPGVTTTIFAPTLSGNGNDPGSNGDTMMSVTNAYETGADMNHQAGLAVLNGPVRNIQMMQHQRQQLAQHQTGPPQTHQQQQLVQASATIIDGSGFYVPPCWAPVSQPTIVAGGPPGQTPQFDETGQLVGLQSSLTPMTTTSCGPPQPLNVNQRRLVQPAMDPRFAPLPPFGQNTVGGGPAMYSMNNMCIPAGATQPQAACMMHESACLHPGASLSSFCPLPGQPSNGGQPPRIFVSQGIHGAGNQVQIPMDSSMRPLRPQNACYFPITDPNGMCSPFTVGSPPMPMDVGVLTAARKTEPRKKRAKTSKAQAGKPRGAVRTNRNSTANAASLPLPKSITPQPLPPPMMMTSPPVLNLQSNMLAPPISRPLSGDWTRMGIPCPMPVTSSMNSGQVSGVPMPIKPESLPPQMQQQHSIPQQTQIQPPAVHCVYQPLNHNSSTERLVCPITHGTVFGPTVLHLNEEQARRSPSGCQAHSFEFELNVSHLQTIVDRSDLDIVVCSHLTFEPLQVCHWPDEAVNIRLNGTLLNLDRNLSADGQPAHKVCGVKSLCRAGRNSLEIILSPAGAGPIAPRIPCVGGLKDHQFAVFMAHMPALNIVLDGLQRRPPAQATPLCDLIVKSWRSRQPDPPPIENDQQQQLPVSVEISLICPVFHTRMQVPGRIVGCPHVDAFDMEAYLHREALWPRLVCPICGNGSPAGLDGLYIDTTLANAMSLAPKSAASIHVRSDGFWSLAAPLAWQWPPNTDVWTPIVGPYTQAFACALQTIQQPSAAHHSGFGPTPPPPSLKRSCEASPIPVQLPPHSTGFNPIYVDGSGASGMADSSPVDCVPLKPEPPSIQWITDSVPVRSPLTANGAPSMSPNPSFQPPSAPQESRKRRYSNNCGGPFLSPSLPTPTPNNTSSNNNISISTSTMEVHSVEANGMNNFNNNEGVINAVPLFGSPSHKSDLHSPCSSTASPQVVSCSPQPFAKPSPVRPSSSSSASSVTKPMTGMVNGDSISKNSSLQQPYNSKLILRKPLEEISESLMQWCVAKIDSLDTFLHAEYLQYVATYVQR